MSDKQSRLTFKQGDLLMGIILLAVSILFYYFSYQFTGYEIEKIANDLGPAFMPRLLLGALMIETIVFILLTISKKIDSPRMQPICQINVLIMFLAFVGYIFLASYIGYIISTLVFMFLSFYLLGIRKLWILLFTPPLITFATYFLFGSILSIYLPSGSLF